MGQTTKKAFVVILDTSNTVWGVFSSEKKARKATRNLVSPFTIRLYELNYRLKNAPPKYLSDEVVAVSDMGGTD